MNEPSITCPKCKSSIKLTESLAAPLIEAERKRAADDMEVRLKARLDSERVAIAAGEAKKVSEKYEAELGRLRTDMAAKDGKLAEARKLETTLRQEREQLVEQKRDLELNVQRRLDEERDSIRTAQAEKTRGEMTKELEAVREDLAAKDKKLAEAKVAELELRRERQKLTEQKEQLELTVQQRVDSERERIKTEQARKTREEMTRELDGVRQELASKDKKLAEATAAELKLRQERQQLTEEKQQLELTVQRRVDQERDKVREQTLRERDDQHRLKIAEKDKVIGDMQKQLEEARHKAEQGSQQLQGDVAEADLEGLLAAQFPHDDIEPIGKGREGGDRVQRVITPSGQGCGSILWERKRTRNWANDWLEKARDDQRAVSANVVVIVSDTLPRGVVTFDRIDGVWVASPSCALPLAAALRQALIDTAMAHRAMEGRQEKESLVYAHVTSLEFRQQIGLMVEALLAMREQHEKEKSAMRRIWAEREKQLDRMMAGTAAIYGGFRGIVGATLPEVAGLALPVPEVPSLPVAEPKALQSQTATLN